jgi:hypothetical protein
MTLVGGHPYLVRVALYHIAKQDMTLDQLLLHCADRSWTLQRPPAATPVEPGAVPGFSHRPGKSGCHHRASTFGSISGV